MRIPWLMKKKPVASSDQPRTAAGTFAARPTTAPAEAMARQVEGENKLLSGTMTTFDSMLQFMDHFDKRIDERVTARIGDSAGMEPEGSEWLPIISQIAGMLDKDQLAGLIHKFTGVAPGSPSGASPSLKSGEVMVTGAEQAGTSPSPQQPPAPAGVNGVSLIKDAANNSPAAIKLAMKAQGFKELAKQGISKEEFKQAIANIHKAVNE